MHLHLYTLFEPPPPKKKLSETGSQLHKPVIPDSQEAEIRRITVQNQPRQIVHKTPSQYKKGLVEWLKWESA
jgi:hypothetical protein